ncbi:hypothetical protein EDB84DRAFT_1465571 [Lactarius hengduanensis]|nr:hypothetical protein EDB84DRAFT_1465571 [Lactarius hengduanensis]
MPTSLLSLPVDVLLSIRDVISSSPFTSADPGLGLLAHLSLSQTCRRLRGIYMLSTPEVRGFVLEARLPMRREYPQSLPGFTLPDTPPPEVLSWKQIALLVTAHKRVCEIRSCRNASCWPDDESHHQSASLAFHPLFYYLHFSAGAELDPAADCRRKVYAPLCGHASAACAFATSPPVQSITLLRPDSDCAIASVRNPNGCTLLDVNRLLGDLLPRSLANMRTVLSHYQTLLDDYRAPGGSFPEAMNCAPHRGFLGDHRYPYLDLSPEDIEAPDSPDVPMGPFIVRCESDVVHVDAVFGVLSHK